ncbi:MAG TPA: substrate-binding domain-containing protein, partial [Chloroflexota bacterium]|nr:substrate-binding domain-containing protein [Chloroflexota bacterium]
GLLAQGITALLCTESPLAARVYLTLAASRVRVPQDVSVVSLSDGTSPWPGPEPLAYVRLDRPAVGERAVQLLLARLEGTADRPQQVLMPCTYVPGASVGPPG